MIEICFVLVEAVRARTHGARLQRPFGILELGELVGGQNIVKRRRLVLQYTRLGGAIQRVIGSLFAKQFVRLPCATVSICRLCGRSHLRR